MKMHYPHLNGSAVIHKCWNPDLRLALYKEDNQIIAKVKHFKKMKFKFTVKQMYCS